MPVDPWVVQLYFDTAGGFSLLTNRLWGPLSIKAPLKNGLQSIWEVITPSFSVQNSRSDRHWAAVSVVYAFFFSARTMGHSYSKKSYTVILLMLMQLCPMPSQQHYRTSSKEKFYISEKSLHAEKWQDKNHKITRELFDLTIEDENTSLLLL